MFAASSSATAVAAPLVAWLMVKLGWRESFYLTSTVAFLIAAVWYWYATDYPREHRDVNNAELTLISANDDDTLASKKSPSVLTLLKDRRVLFLSLSYVSEGYVLFMFVFWLYTYLVEVRRFTMLRGGIVESLPWLTAMVMAPIGGWVCDRVSRRTTRLSASRWVIMIGYGTSGLLLFGAAETSSRAAAVAALSVSIGALYFAESAFWTAAAYLSGEHAGAISGVMNTAGIVGGIASTLLVPELVEHFGWLVALSSGAVMGVMCTLLWWVLGRNAGLHIAST